MTTALHEAEAVGNKGVIGQAGVGRRVTAGCMEVTECCALVDEYATGQVNAQRNTGVQRRFFDLLQLSIIAAVATHGDGTMLLHDVTCQFDAVITAVTAHDKADRAEQLLTPDIFLGSIDGHDQRAAYTRILELRVSQAL